MKSPDPRQESDQESPSGFKVIDSILRDSEAGETAAVLSEKYNVPPSVIYHWRALFLPAFKHQQRVMELEQEIAQMKQFVADAMADGLAARAHVQGQIASGSRSIIRPLGARNCEQPNSECSDGGSVGHAKECSSTGPTDSEA
jgi:hypothetical protein